MNEILPLPSREMLFNPNVGLADGGRRRPASRQADTLETGPLAATLTAAAFENARLANELRSSRVQVRRLARQVVAVQEEERLRISRELHDEAGQALTALKFSLAALSRELENPATARSRLADLIDLADQTMDQIRRLAHDLRPCALDRLPIVEVLEGVCSEFARRTGLEIAFCAAGAPPLSGEAEVSFYRFLQETLTNAAKHAAAARIDVRFETTGDACVLSVADDGTGICNNEPCAAGAGLTGQRERFELLGGWIRIDSSPGGGACIRAGVPIGEFGEAEK